MACADVDMDIHRTDEEPPREEQRETQKTWYYQASEMVPDKKGPLHNLMQKQPAVLGSIQMVSGLLSVGVGFIFAATWDMRQSLSTLFRVSILSGILFISAGVVSNLLIKYPALISVSTVVNCSCIVVAVVAACLIGYDLSTWSLDNEHYLKLELLELCVLALMVILSVILCAWLSKEKRSKLP